MTKYSLRFKLHASCSINRRSNQINRISDTNRSIVQGLRHYCLLHQAMNRYLCSTSKRNIAFKLCDVLIRTLIRDLVQVALATTIPYQISVSVMVFNQAINRSISGSYKELQLFYYGQLYSYQGLVSQSNHRSFSR